MQPFGVEYWQSLERISRNSSLLFFSSTEESWSSFVFVVACFLAKELMFLAQHTLNNRNTAAFYIIRSLFKTPFITEITLYLPVSTKCFATDITGLYFSWYFQYIFYFFTFTKRAQHLKIYYYSFTVTWTWSAISISDNKIFLILMTSNSSGFAIP